MNFSLSKLLRDVFDPQPGERVLVMVDLPHGQLVDSADWADRRRMAEEWRQAFLQLRAEAHPLLAYAATGASNSDLPERGTAGGNLVEIAQVLADANIAVAMTQFSATAPLSAFTKRLPHLRAASMPNVLRRMTESALAADYAEVARKAHALRELLQQSESAEVVFDTGHRCRFDLRWRTAKADDGMCRRDKEGFRVINLPSGEAFIVPYEGERPGEPSRTQGIIPLRRKGELMLLHVEANRIVEVAGTGPESQRIRAHFDEDPARRNIAELGLGCNDCAIVTGNVLEDEKAGLHWAYGRSEHLGGTVGPDAFLKPAHVVHHDVVYARGCPIGVTSLTLLGQDGAQREIMRDSLYTIF